MYSYNYVTHDSGSVSILI